MAREVFYKWLVTYANKSGDKMPMADSSSSMADAENNFKLVLAESHCESTQIIRELFVFKYGRIILTAIYI